MLTRDKLKASKGELDPFNPKFGHAHWTKKMENEDYQVEDEKAFRKAFYQMVDRVEKLFGDYQRRLEKKIRKQMKTRGSTLGKKGNGGDPP